jgi:hypothetical protein
MASADRRKDEATCGSEIEEGPNRLLKRLAMSLLIPVKPQSLRNAWLTQKPLEWEIRKKAG